MDKNIPVKIPVQDEIETTSAELLQHPNVGIDNREGSPAFRAENAELFEHPNAFIDESEETLVLGNDK